MAPHPEDSLSAFVSEAGSEQQAVQLLHAPLQQHGLHLLARRAALQQLVQHIQSSHRLNERGGRQLRGGGGHRAEIYGEGRVKSEVLTRGVWKQVWHNINNKESRTNESSRKNILIN